MGLYISRIICPFVGLLYPSYASFKAIETPQPHDDTQWLTYWVVYAVFAIFELFGDYLVFWVPFYYELKIVIITLLQLPQFQLAHHGYVTLIQPWFKAKEKDIDAFLDNLKGLVLAKINQGLQFLIANSPAIIAGVLTSLQNFASTTSTAAAQPSQNKSAPAPQSQQKQKAKNMPTIQATEDSTPKASLINNLNSIFVRSHPDNMAAPIASTVGDAVAAEVGKRATSQPVVVAPTGAREDEKPPAPMEELEEGEDKKER